MGMHHRMGGKVVQDYGLSRKVATTLQGLLEEEWVASRHDALKRLQTTQLACFVFLGYVRALHGDEIKKIALGGVRKYFADGALEPKHVNLSSIGGFKKLESEQQHFLPVAAVTGSEIKTREWVERLLLEKAEVGLTLGILFLKKMGLVEILEWIQQNTTGIIPLSINLWEEFGVRRSMRIGTTMEAPNVGIDGPTIGTNNGWRRVEVAKGKMLR
jgi:hypothetical protein